MVYSKNYLQEAIDYAYTNGMVKYNSGRALIHAPFILSPYGVSQGLLQKMIALTPRFNQMLIKVANDREFLKHHLEPVAKTDPFIETLFSLQSKENTQPLQLLINRNDYLLSLPQDKLSLEAKQVEINTISASFPFLATRVHQMHQDLYYKEKIGHQLLLNNPLKELVDNIAEAIRHYHHPDTCLLMVVQPHDKNVFDQRGIEYALLKSHGIPTIRLTLEEVADYGKLKEGHLKIKPYLAAVTYFRAAYNPEDLESSLAFKGRQMIESSSSIKVPDIGMQLAGSKKIQQVLTNPDQLSRYVPAKVLQDVLSTFVGQYQLEDPVKTADGEVTAMEHALKVPERYVLKPQREGGGNNVYGQQIPEFLKALAPSQYPAYILMEYIPAMEHKATLVVEEHSTETQCVSEIGRYGLCLAERGLVLRNEDAGYLVRTKAAHLHEGGVCAGYACLNSLFLETNP
ncbi:glutathione synthase [Deltaproteobacteria bacterium TL4]